MLMCAYAFAFLGAMLAAVIHRTGEVPVLRLAIASAVTLGFALPITVGAGFSPSLQPIRDLAAGSERVAAGDTASACRLFRMTTLVHWPRLSIACRRVWLSGNDFRVLSAPT